MRVLLWLIVLLLIVADTFQLTLGLAPGLSAKNLLLYVAVMLLAWRVVLTRELRVDLPGMLWCFSLLLFYAIASMLLIALKIRYPHYDLIVEAMFLKGNLFDHFMFFLVFFYGCSTMEDSRSAIRALMFAALFANLLTSLDGAGIVRLGVTEINFEGRVQGAMGEQNQYGAFLIALLPGLVAQFLYRRGFLRLVWALAIASSLAALLMTASRGAMVGLLVSSAWGAMLFRRYLSMGRIFAWGIGAVAAIVLVVTAISFQYAEVLRDHVVEGTFSGSLTDKSSGRTELWMPALRLMMEYPWTLITGFGWDAYSHLLVSVTHNHYLDLWFNLGILGVVCFVAIFVRAVSNARAAVEVAPPDIRAELIGFVFGLLGVAVAIFFVNLYAPWPYIWAYVGAAMRLAVEVRRQVPVPAPAPAARPLRAPVRSARAPGAAPAVRRALGNRGG